MGNKDTRFNNAAKEPALEIEVERFDKDEEEEEEKLPSKVPRQQECANCRGVIPYHYDPKDWQVDQQPTATLLHYLRTEYEHKIDSIRYFVETNVPGMKRYNASITIILSENEFVWRFVCERSYNSKKHAKEAVALRAMHALGICYRGSTLNLDRI
jgi:hypothetical protein